MSTVLLPLVPVEQRSRNSGPLCADPGLDPRWWFSEKTAETALAVEICNDCPQKKACLKGAKARREEHGVWGGVIMSSTRRCRQGHLQEEHSIMVGGARRCGVCYRASLRRSRARRKETA